jgi:predicted ArsR family transcriptional regulator
VVNGNGEETKNKILELLKKHPDGLTIADISKELGLHRQTVTKYVFELRGAEIVRTRTVGPATLIYLNHRSDHK